MKVSSDIPLEATPDQVWAVLTDFASYPEWNPLIKAASGTPTPQGHIEVTVGYLGSDLLTGSAEVTGWVPGKYFSFVIRKGPNWWYQEEHIFRIKEKDSGKIVFYNEIYATGLSLRFGRKNASHRMRYAVDQMNEALQDRLKAAQA
jgi:hypothetical protein